MPLFTSFSGFQINGGSFLEIVGDMNLRRTQRTVTIGQNSGPLAALEFDLTEGPSRQLSEVERNGRHRGPARMLPYGILPVFRFNMDLTQSKIFLSGPRFRVLRSTLLFWPPILTLGPLLLSLSHRS